MEKPKRIPIADNPEKLTKPAQRVLEALSDATLCRQHVSDERTLENAIYWLEPGGAKVDPWTFKELLRKSKIIPIQDGLFEGDTQSYRAA